MNVKFRSRLLDMNLAFFFFFKDYTAPQNRAEKQQEVPFRLSQYKQKVYSGAALSGQVSVFILNPKVVLTEMFFLFIYLYT